MNSVRAVGAGFVRRGPRAYRSNDPARTADVDGARNRIRNFCVPGNGEYITIIITNRVTARRFSHSISLFYSSFSYNNGTTVVIMYHTIVAIIILF